jgi:hypothetical protein
MTGCYCAHLKRSFRAQQPPVTPNINAFTLGKIEIIYKRGEHFFKVDFYLR